MLQKNQCFSFKYCNSIARSQVSNIKVIHLILCTFFRGTAYIFSFFRQRATFDNCLLSNGYGLSLDNILETSYGWDVWTYAGVIFPGSGKSASSSLQQQGNVFHTLYFIMVHSRLYMLGWLIENVYYFK